MPSPLNSLRIVHNVFLRVLDTEELWTAEKLLNTDRLPAQLTFPEQEWCHERPVFTTPLDLLAEMKTLTDPSYDH